MSRSFAGRLLVVLLVVAGAVVLAVGAYNAGVSAGIGSAGAGAASGAVAPYAWGYAWHGAVGFPWFFLWPIAPLFFILLVFLLFRAAFWGGRRGWGDSGRGWWGPNGSSEGPMGRLEEWHRHAHESGSGQGGDANPPRSPQQ